MTEWKEYKLGEIVSIASGFAYKGEYIGKGENLLLGMGCVSYKEKFLLSGARPYAGDCAERYYAKVGDILLATRQQSDNLPILGMPAIIPEDLKDKKLIIGANLYRVTNNSDFDNKYIYWLLKTPDYVRYIASCKTGTTVAMITKSDIENFAFVAPDKSGRERILKIMDSLDDKIDLLHRENKTLEAMAETLFRQWFIEEAKEDWEEGKLGDLIDETIGGEWGKENPEGAFIKPVQCIRGTDIADLSVGLATKTPIRYVKESKFERIEPRNGDIIMEISGGTENQSTGRVAYVNDEVKTLFDYPIIFSNFCRLLKVKEEHTYFIYCYLKYLYDQDEFFNLENGSSGIKNLDYKTLLYEITYPMPNDKLQILDFNDNVSVYFEKINRNKKQIQTLIQQRDSLLPKLMSGEVKI